MKVDIPLGDVVDRVTICAIKTRRITDPTAVAHAQRELDTLRAAWKAEGYPPMEDVGDFATLARINEELWQVEDALRDCERQRDFGETFVTLARSVYTLNDQRALQKRRINDELGSDLVEVKSYAAY